MSLKTYLSYKPYLHMRNADDFERNEKIKKFFEGHREEELLLESFWRKEADKNQRAGVLVGFLIGFLIGIVFGMVWIVMELAF